MSLARTLLVLVLAAIPAPAAARQPYRDASLPVDARVRDLLARMTREEKFWQLWMTPGSLDDPAHDWSHGAFGLQIATAPGDSGNASAVARAHAARIDSVQRYFVEETRLGIPIIPFDEALHGLARPGATVFPQAIGLAATWDTALVGRVARAVARETRARGIRQVLSPVVNIASDVRWGRVEETYGEDPYLAARMAEPFIRSFETAGIIATPKHFVANVGDGGRDSYPVSASERFLEDVHFPPFIAALQAGARSVMTAYNSVDGLPATQNPWLLRNKLKGEWGFDGFVISDAAATGGPTVLHMTEPNARAAARHALEAGLDVIFQSSWEQHRPYRAAVLDTTLADSIVDGAVARVLRAKFELGLFEDPYVDPDSAAFWNGHADHRALAREAAAASLVLLKNERSTLPLNGSAQSIAVIGTDALDARLGGYSGPGIRPVSILDGIRARAGAAVRVTYAPGPGRFADSVTVVPASALSHTADGRRLAGLRGEYFDGIRIAGVPVAVRADTTLDFRWTFNPPAAGLSTDDFSVRWTGTLTAPAGGVTRLGIEGNDGYRLWLDGELLIDNWRKQSYRTVLRDVTLTPGRSFDLRVEFFEPVGNSRIRLVWDAGAAADPQAAIDSAVAIAARSDIAIIVAGIEEGEFRDRAQLGLPGRQADLIRAVARTGRPVVVVLIGGSAITMSAWLDDVAAVLLAWYPGEEGGTAVAEALFGDAVPAGRLPITFPIAEGQLPLVYNHTPTGRGDDYLDLTGEPLFPFGFGLSYTTFDYSNLSITRESSGVTVRCTITNTGSRAGDEVVQLYVRDVVASVARPVRELKGFLRVHLSPGESRDVVFTLTDADLGLLDANLRRVLEPGTFHIMVGASSLDIRLQDGIEVR